MKILKKKYLVNTERDKIIQLEIDAADIAKSAKPGQFVVVMVSEEGERTPLTVVNTENNILTIIFQQVGLSTGLLAQLEEGDSVYAVSGPLGHPTEIQNFGKVIVLGGGVGIAEIFPVIKALKNAGNHITSILGARNKDLLILKDEIEEYSDVFLSSTDDGSFGEKGYNTQLLENTLKENNSDMVYAVGPIAMMRKVCGITSPYNIKTLVSLNALMLDGTGMCGCCRVTIGDKVKFACVDGPEFDGHLVDWQELEKKTKMYEEKEKHICKIGLK